MSLTEQQVYEPDCILFWPAPTVSIFASLSSASPTAFQRKDGLTKLVEIPLTFARSWSYIRWALSLLVIEQDGCIEGAEGDVLPGAYTIKRPQDMPFTLTAGAASKRALRVVPSTATGVSDSSGTPSSGPSGQHTRFREALLRRDGACVVTNFPDVVPCHLAPVSLPEVYEAVVGVRMMHTAQCGMLMEPTTKRLFDAYKIAFWPREDGSLEFHNFCAQHPPLSGLHGLVLPPERFRFPAFLSPPDRRLLEWHYQQCAIMHFYSAALFTGAPAG